MQYAPQDVVDMNRKGDGLTALHMACHSGLLSIAEMLITKASHLSLSSGFRGDKKWCRHLIN